MSIAPSAARPSRAGRVATLFRVAAFLSVVSSPVVHAQMLRGAWATAGVGSSTAKFSCRYDYCYKPADRRAAAAFVELGFTAGGGGRGGGRHRALDKDGGGT